MTWKFQKYPKNPENVKKCPLKNVYYDLSTPKKAYQNSLTSYDILLYSKIKINNHECINVNVYLVYYKISTHFFLKWKLLFKNEIA